MNLETISMGGGCEGLYLEHPLGRITAGYFVITDVDGCHIPRKGEKAIIGWYTDNSQFIESLDIIY